MRKQPGFFDIDERLTRLSDLGDRLKGFRSAVDFEMFRDALEQALAYAEGVQGGRPPARSRVSWRWLPDPNHLAEVS